MDPATRVYRVDGMTCGGCARSVANAVRAVAPALPVDVAHGPPGTLTVRGPHDVDALRHAVEDAGFDWVGPVSA